MCRFSCAGGGEGARNTYPKSTRPPPEESSKESDKMYIKIRVRDTLLPELSHLSPRHNYLSVDGVPLDSVHLASPLAI
eukprot:5240334-Pyramimonas_sp.AAC.1